MRWSCEIAIPVKPVNNLTAWSLVSLIHKPKDKKSFFISFWHWKALFSGKKFFLK
jgi:hypothetical protein